MNNPFPNEDWSGLRSLGRVLLRTASILAMAGVGFVSLGFIGGVLTIWIYALGAGVAAPTGCVLGGILGYRMKPGHSFLVLTAALAGGWLGRAMDNGDSFLHGLGYLAGFTLAATLTLPICLWIEKRHQT